MPILRVVIPHYGPQELLDRAMQSVNESTDSAKIPGWSVQKIVVDNNKQNRLFTGGVNAGLAVRGMPPADIYWITNNDAIAEPDCARNAIGRIMSWPHLALIGCRNVSIADPDRITWGGSGPCWPGGRHSTGSVKAGDCGQVTKQEWVPFASVFIRREALEEVGLLDRNLQHIFSDCDWCFRARWAGRVCLYDPACQVRHDFASSATPSPMIQKVMDADRARFHAKWRGQWLAQLSVWPAA